MAFDFDLSERLQKRVEKLAKKDRILAMIFMKKIQEVIRHDTSTIDTYKNLKSPKKEYKRIHLTDNYILLFTVDKKHTHILFTDILHWDKAYK